MDDTIFNKEILELRKSISCGICLDTYHDPICLDSCSHSSCRKCIMEVINKTDNGKSSHCPFCKTVFTKRNIIKMNSLQTLIDSISNIVISLDPSLMKSPTTVHYTVTSNNNKMLPSNAENDQLLIVNDVNANNLKTPLTTSTRAAISLINNNNITTTNTLDTSSLKIYRPGEIVTVLPRTWPGINKPGGAAYITCRNDSENCYDVRYILSNTKDKSVPAAFIKPEQEEGPRVRKRNQTASPSSSISFKRKPLDELTPSEQNKKRGKTNFQTPNKITTQQPPTPSTKIVLLASTLQDINKESVKKFTDTFGADYADSFGPSITHLVVSADKDKVMRHRTMKYMQAIMTGIWIVSADWLNDCLTQGHLLPENDYEIRRNIKADVDDAPRRARKAVEKNTKLFTKHCILLYGGFPNPGPNKVDVTCLLRNGGATIFNCLRDMIAFVRQHGNCTLVAIAAEQTYQEKLIDELEAHKKELRGIKMVTLAWVLDTVTNFQVQNYNDYTVT